MGTDIKADDSPKKSTGVPSEGGLDKTAIPEKGNSCFI